MGFMKHNHMPYFVGHPMVLTTDNPLLSLFKDFFFFLIVLYLNQIKQILHSISNGMDSAERSAMSLKGSATKKLIIFHIEEL